MPINSCVLALPLIVSQCGLCYALGIKLADVALAYLFSESCNIIICNFTLWQMTGHLCFVVHIAKSIQPSLKKYKGIM